MVHERFKEAFHDLPTWQPKALEIYITWEKYLDKQNDFQLKQVGSFNIESFAHPFNLQ